MKDYRPRSENAMSWLGYVHELLDMDQLVNLELKNLFKQTTLDDFKGIALN